MKLFTKTQVAFRCAFCVVIGIAFSAVCLSLYLLADRKHIVSTKESPTPLINGQPVAFGMTDDYTADELANISVYEKCNEAVVNITTKVMSINWFLDPVLQEGGSGSGSIIDKRGYVVTNCHVIEDTSKIYISLADGSQYEGKIVGADTASDIAVLKFTPDAGVDLKVIPFGKSTDLKVGQKVIAIGNPFALERTMTVGIVSGLGRPIQETKSTIIRNMIQTDTAINPGNSGGPLLDTKGRMIGINTMIISTSGSSAGLNFAVPVETAGRVVLDLIKYGKVQRGIINAELLPLNANFARQANLNVNSGLLVSRVRKGSNAAKSGLQGGTQEVTYTTGWNKYTFYLGGDIILGIDGIACDSMAALNSVLESHKPGDKVKLHINRNGKEGTLTLTLDEE